MKNQYVIVVVIIIMLVNGSCSYYPITQRSDLRELNGKGHLKIQTVDSLIYTFDSFTFTDSTIHGYGTIHRLPYDSVFRFSDIVHLECLHFNLGKTLWGVVAVSAVVGGVVSAASGDHFEIYQRKSGSCPFVYSYNGKDYTLAGEAFGTSLGKALETETCIVLPDEAPIYNTLKVKITNERPETHFFNSIGMYAVDLDSSSTLYSTNHNTLVALQNHKNIKKATEGIRDITALLRNDDNIFWESDLSSANLQSGFEDNLSVEMKGIQSQDSLSLIVSAINTNISSTVFEYLQQTLGDEFANFTKAAEVNPGLISILKKILERSALKIDIWDGNGWKYADMIPPEANQVKFKKVVRLPLSSVTPSELKIRLRCMSDVWKIDAVSFDDSRPQAITPVCQKLQSYSTLSANGKDSTIILTRDNRYMTLLPGQNIELNYSFAQVPPGHKVSYAVNVGGYLYERLIDPSNTPGDLLKDLDASTPKLQAVLHTLQDFDIILPIIYKKWRNTKNQAFFPDK